MQLYSPNYSYRLVLAADGSDRARTLEFQALSAEAALQQARPHCSGREAELFEEGRSLGRVRCVADGGYWRLASERSQPL